MDAHKASGGSAASPVALVLAAGAAVVTLWFLAKIVTALLLFFFALVVAIALSAAVRWFERRGLARRWAAALALVLFFASLGLIAWLVIPRVAAQVVVLVNSLPRLLIDINHQIAELLSRYPELQAYFQVEGGPPEDLYPAAIGLFRGGLGLSLTLLGGVALLIIFLSSVLYVVVDPRPILRAYIGSLPLAHRAAGMRAYRRAARAVIGWTKASLVMGTIQFVAVFVFLSFIGLPGALVWAALAFFAEFIPRIGGFIMASPPVLIALTLGPMTAVWVALFYLVMDELLGNFIGPRVRGTTMRLHPLLLIFFTLAFALAFGLLGAIVATPAAAFFAAFYSEFYIKRPLSRGER